MVRLPRLTLALMLSLAAFAAQAADYVVVGSSDPAIARGQAYEAGARITLAPGQSLTLMHASGALVRLKGSAGGVVAPRERATTADADRMAVLRFIMSDADKPATRGAMRTRSGICPSPELLTSLDAIAQAQQGGCVTGAAKAFEAWLNAHADEVVEP